MNKVHVQFNQYIIYHMKQFVDPLEFQSLDVFFEDLSVDLLALHPDSPTQSAMCPQAANFLPWRPSFAAPKPGDGATFEHGTMVFLGSTVSWHPTC